LDYCATPIWDDQGNLIGYDPNSCVPDNQYYGQFGYAYVEPQIVNTGAPPTSNSGFWTSLMGVWDTAVNTLGSLPSWVSNVPWAGSITGSFPVAPPVVGVGPTIVSAYNPSQGQVCVGGGLAATVPGVTGAKSANFGPLLFGNQANTSRILSGWSLSVGIQLSPGAGYQYIANSYGVLSGPTVGVPGASVSLTYATCSQ